MPIHDNNDRCDSACLFRSLLPIDHTRNPTGEMDGYDDDDDDYDDGVVDDNLSVASVDNNNEVEGNTDFNSLYPVHQDQRQRRY